MKNSTIKLFAACLVSLGAVFTSQLQTTAASQYSAARSNDVKLIWRHAMGRHAYTATTGARYSEHLGTRYGFNTETAKVTWYTTAHEKLYFKDSRTYAIYYHVTNASQSLQGWIWNGYLKPVTTSTGTTSTPTHPGSGDTSTSNGNPSATTPVTTNNSANNDNYSDNAQEFNDIDNIKFAQQILQLSPNMVEDEKLDDLAKYDLWMNDNYRDVDQNMFTNHLVQEYGGEPRGLEEDWGYVGTPDISLVKTQLSNKLNEIDYTNLSNYDGYHIGVATEAESSPPSEKIEKINYVVWILPANPIIAPQSLIG
jgi:hypothetical protein